MKVLRAQHAGACYGVQRALDMAQKAAETGLSAYTLGPLIHNPQVVSELQAQGVRVAEGVADVEDGSTVIIRSHGVTPQVRSAVLERGLPLVDATCPHVARAQAAAAQVAEEGCRVLIVGEEGHPEVEGIKACARQLGAKVDVVGGPDAVPLDLRDPIGVVAQTTQMRANFEAVVAAVRAQGIEARVKNTICSATRQRQEAAVALSQQVDAIVVIGGRNSSNTTRLAELCQAVCSCAYHVESPDEIDPSWFEGCETVGVTAGASTPEAHIRAAVCALEAL